MQSQRGYTWLGTDKQLLILRLAEVTGPCMQIFAMRIQIDVAVDTVCAGVPSFEELACLFGASHGDHFSSLPIEAVVAINGVRKHERQGIASADGQFVFVYVGPKSSTCMAYVSAREIRTCNAVNNIGLLLFGYEIFNT
ncbi:unnamed protein product [Schistocephalus solidus]|uniref:Uncharacterized protein n=1 Tax=Schistocephalus solidus TaxID=70667 RepID=A0A183TT21_SCHSO|nr:unnamed protein product [Schistocephalus solidus]